jgi:hypothetical protein
MSKETDKDAKKASADLVLQEVWRAKDALSAANGHDVDKLFAELRERERSSTHPVVNFQKRNARDD